MLNASADGAPSDKPQWVRGYQRSGGSRELANAPSTAVMTTNVAPLVVAPAEQARQRIARLLPAILGFVLGCATGAAADAAPGLCSPAVPTVFALLVFALRSPSAVRN